MSATVSGAPCPINMAQHTYFNLAGADSGASILDHVLRMPSASHYTPVDVNLIPTGTSFLPSSSVFHSTSLSLERATRTRS